MSEDEKVVDIKDVSSDSEVADEKAAKPKRVRTAKPKSVPEDVQDDEDVDYEELETILNDSETEIINEIITERRLHRSALANLHKCYEREDARRILENLPYQRAELIPVIRQKNDRNVMIWIAETIDGLISDLKQKFAYYDEKGLRSKAIDAHDLLKKVEAQKKVK